MVWRTSIAIAAIWKARVSFCSFSDPRCLGEGTGDALCESFWQAPHSGSCRHGDPLVGIPPEAPWFCNATGSEAQGDRRHEKNSIFRAPLSSSLRIGSRDGVPASQTWSSCEYCALRGVGEPPMLTAEIYDGIGSLAFSSSSSRGSGSLTAAQTQWAPFFSRKSSHTHHRSRIEGAVVPRAFDVDRCERWVETPTFVFHMLTWQVGHLLVDVLEPLHSAMERELGRGVTDDIVLVLDVPNPAERAVLHQAILEQVYSRDSPFQLLRALTRHPIHTMSSLAALPGPTCFRRLFLGLDPTLTYFSEGALRHAFLERPLPAAGAGKNGKQQTDSTDAEDGATMSVAWGGEVAFWLERLSLLDPALNPDDAALQRAYCRFQSFIVEWALKETGVAADGRSDRVAGAGECVNRRDGGDDACHDDKGGITVAFIRRAASRRVSNMDELIAVAAATTPAEAKAGAGAEAKVKASATKAGVAVAVEELRLEDMAWPEQLAALRRADVLVGAHGTGMHNVLFMRPGSVAVLLMPPSWCPWAWQVADQAVATGIHVLLSCQEPVLPATQRRWRRWRWCERCWRQGPWYTRYPAFEVDVDVFSGLLRDAYWLLASADDGTKRTPRFHRMALRRWGDPTLSANVTGDTPAEARARLGHVAATYVEDSILLEIVPEVVSNIEPWQLGLEGRFGDGDGDEGSCGSTEDGDREKSGGGGGKIGGQKREGEEIGSRGGGDSSLGSSFDGGDTAAIKSSEPSSAAAVELGLHAGTPADLRWCLQIFVGGTAAVADACFRHSDLGELNTVAFEIPASLLEPDEVGGDNPTVIAVAWLRWGDAGAVLPNSEAYYPISLAPPLAAAADDVDMIPASSHRFFWDEVRPVPDVRLEVLLSIGSREQPTTATPTGHDIAGTGGGSGRNGDTAGDSGNAGASAAVPPSAGQETGLAILSIAQDDELRMQRELAAFCRAQTPPLTQFECGQVAVHAYRAGQAGIMAAAVGLPTVAARMPTPGRPLIFLHLEKCGGSSLRKILAESAITRELRFFIPCYTRSGYDPTPINCVHFDLQGLMADERVGLQVVGMHPARGWDVWKDLPTVQNEESFDCIVMLRDPVERIIAYYYERVHGSQFRREYVPHTSKRLNSFTPEELSILLSTARGVTAPGFLDPAVPELQVYTDDGMSDAACKMLCGVEAGRRGPAHEKGAGGDDAVLPPPACSIVAAMHRLSRCVVGSVEQWADTKAALLHWFPWLVVSDDAVRNPSWWAAGVREKRAELRPDLVDVIIKHNPCDVALHAFAMERFREQRRVVAIARGSRAR